ncbi:MAG: hypothetical protein HZA20_01500 [Nitrospirae bacterium]|nr:hypothetical protein [Nitrospirota bacterium]
MAHVIPLLFLLSSSAAWADVSIGGFAQGGYALGTSSNPDGGDFKSAEERFQLRIDAASGPFGLFLKTDAAWEHAGENADIELREAYANYSADMWDLRVGRQVITWGTGDLVFINDVFPKDYAAFFSGRPMEYFKAGIDGVKIGLYPSFASFDLVLVPEFEQDNYPDGARFHLYDPMPGVTDRSRENPASGTKKPEIALRIYRNIGGFDASAYFYRGFWRQPAMIPDNPAAPSRITLTYPALSVYGASIQGSALDGVVNLEAGYYNSCDDSDGSDPMIPNSQARFLVGYQRQFWEDFTLGAQYYTEYMIDHAEYDKNLPSGFPAEKKLNQLASARATQFLMHQTLRLSFFAFYSLSGGDYLLNPEAKYNFTDHVWGALGGNIFGGGHEWSRFGQMDKDDNIYIQARYEF